MEIARIIDAFDRVSVQVEDVVDQIETPKQQFQLLRQYADALEPSNDKLIDVSEVWKGGFYLKYGPEVEDSLLLELRGSLAAGKFDYFVADELFRDEEAPIEAVRMREFARHMSGGQGDWYERMLQRPDLYGADVVRALADRRTAMVESIDEVTNNMGSLLRIAAIGRGDHALAERGRLWKEMLNAQKMRMGSKAARRALQIEMAQERGAHKRQRTDTAGEAPDENAPAMSEAGEREPKPVAEYKYDYRNEAPSTTAVAETVDAYATTDGRLKDGLLASLDYISANFGTGEKVRGIKKVRLASDLWEMKPTEAPGIGNKVSSLRQARLLFTERDGSIELVDIVHRDRLPKAIESLLSGRINR
jgi:hypothetical protein